MSSQNTSPALPDGTRLKAYTIDGVLGQDALGFTYAAHRDADGTAVVIRENLPCAFVCRDVQEKLVRPAGADDTTRNNYETALTSFLGEAHGLTKLHHPCLGRVLESFHFRGTGYYVMARVEGEPLDLWIRQHNPLGKEAVEELALKLIDALGHLHGQGLRHLNLKPSNILMTPGDVPVIIGYGAARWDIGRLCSIKPDSPGYTPFEMLHSKEKVDVWSDFYSLGAVFHWLITGITPPDALSRVMYDEVKPLALQAAYTARHGAAFLAGVDKALKIQVYDRWLSAADWRDSLAGGSADPAATGAEELFERGGKYHHGHGVPQDLAEAVKCYRAAAAQGHAGAQCNLGNCLYNGSGVPQDEAEAAKWFRRAAAQGDPVAQCNLGNCHYHGRGVVQDYAEAVKWFRAAAGQGDPVAQCRLAACYQNGQGVDKDDAAAAEWFRKAAAQGHMPAQFSLGMCYYHGRGLAKDPTEAVEWFRKAADQGGASAQVALGLCYCYGEGVGQDYAEAVELFRNAAEADYASAQYNLGVCYQNGQGVAQDRLEAAFLYRKAAAQGHAGAADALQRLGF